MRRWKTGRVSLFFRSCASPVIPVRICSCRRRCFQERREALRRIAAHTEEMDALVFVGLPLEKDGKLYNVAAALHDGRVLAFIPKTALPNYAEFYEVRHFNPRAGAGGVSGF